MPQINGLPTTEPVAHPQASPAEFAIPGNTSADMGQETANMAQANMAFEGHLAYAQRQLTYKQIEIDVSKAEELAYDDLKKSTTPEEAQAAHSQFNQQVSNILTPHMGDKALARELHLYSQRVDVEMQHHVNAKKADIITKNGRIADGIMVDKAVQEASNIGIADGDWSVVRDRVSLKLQSGVSAGWWQPEQAEAIMEKFNKKVDTSIIKGKYNSNDPEVRKQIIEQLNDDTNFPSLDDADRAAYRVAAEKRDNELSNIRKKDDYNAAVTQFNDDTEGWPFPNKAAATQSNKYLKEHGYIDKNGNPDHVTGDKLLEEVNRQEATHQKAEKDKDEEVVSKYLSKFDTGKFSDNQIDKIVQEQGGSPKAAGTLKSASHQAIGQRQSSYRFGEFVKEADHRAFVREYHKAKDNGESLSADLQQRMTNGESIDMSQVWDTVREGDMTKDQALQVQSHMEALKDKSYKYNATRIANATGISDKDKGDLTLDLLDAKTKQGMQGNELNALTDKLMQDHGKKVIDDSANQFFHNLFRPPLSKGEGKKTGDTAPVPRPQEAVETSTINGVEYYFDVNHKNLGRVK